MRLGLAAALAAIAAVAVAPGAAHAKTTWLCKPGQTPNPCAESLATTLVASDGTSTRVNPPLAKKAKVDCFYVYPTVDVASRTVNVRMVVDNKDGTLRPGNFATVELPVLGGEVLTVPDHAVIDTGFRRIVYVASGEGRFRPVEVEVGRRVGDRAEIRKGLAEGDQVVVSAQFLVDSESRLRAAGSRPGHGGH